MVGEMAKIRRDRASQTHSLSQRGSVAVEGEAAEIVEHSTGRKESAAAPTCSCLRILSHGHTIPIASGVKALR